MATAREIWAKRNKIQLPKKNGKPAGAPATGNPAGDNKDK